MKVTGSNIGRYRPRHHCSGKLAEAITFFFVKMFGNLLKFYTVEKPPKDGAKVLMSLYDEWKILNQKQAIHNSVYL